MCVCVCVSRFRLFGVYSFSVFGCLEKTCRWFSREATRVMLVRWKPKGSQPVVDSSLWNTPMQRATCDPERFYTRFSNCYRYVLKTRQGAGQESWPVVNWKKGKQFVLFLFFLAASLFLKNAMLFILRI